MNIKALVFFLGIFFSLFSSSFSMKRCPESLFYTKARGQVVLTYSLILKLGRVFSAQYQEHYLTSGKEFESYYRMLYTLDHLLAHISRPAQSEEEENDYESKLSEWKKHFLLEILLSLLEVNIIITNVCDYQLVYEVFVVDLERTSALTTFYSGRQRRYFIDELMSASFEENFGASLVEIIISFLHVNKSILIHLVSILEAVKESELEIELARVMEQCMRSSTLHSGIDFFWDWLKPLQVWIVENISSLSFDQIYRHVTFQDGLEIKEEMLRRTEEEREKLIRELKLEGLLYGMGSCAVPAGAKKMLLSKLRERLEAIRLMDA